MKPITNIIGQRFGMLTVVKHVPKAEALAAGEKYGHYVAQCDCGRTTKASSSTAFTSGLRVSCGCYRPSINPGIATSNNRIPRDLTGQRFGKLIAVKLAPSVGKGRYWFCACDCGGSRVVRASHLCSESAKACTECGKSKRAKQQGYDLTGMRFGILTVSERAPIPSGGQGCHWRCLCDCGTPTIARAKDLRNGNTASCGCLKPFTEQTRAGRPTLDINRPWRKAEQVDDRWLLLVGERAPRMLP